MYQPLSDVCPATLFRTPVSRLSAAVGAETKVSPGFACASGVDGSSSSFPGRRSLPPPPLELA